MRISINKTLAAMVGFTLALFMLAGCGSSSDKGPTLQDIPTYPNSTKGESMGQSSLGGIVSAKLEQYTTEDSYDQVMKFYIKALSKFKPKVNTHNIEPGRRLTAIVIAQKNGNITVAIQEFQAEGKVNITLMRVVK